MCVRLLLVSGLPGFSAIYGFTTGVAFTLGFSTVFTYGVFFGVAFTGDFTFALTGVLAFFSFFGLGFAYLVFKLVLGVGLAFVLTLIGFLAIFFFGLATGLLGAFFLAGTFFVITASKV